MSDVGWKSQAGGMLDEVWPRVSVGRMMDPSSLTSNDIGGVPCRIPFVLSTQNLDLHVQLYSCNSTSRSTGSDLQYPIDLLSTGSTR